MTYKLSQWRIEWNILDKKKEIFFGPLMRLRLQSKISKFFTAILTNNDSFSDMVIAFCII